jgi:nucleotide-binding universal stress UspA family protein
MSRTIGYRSILVPLADNAETDTALDIACRLAAERHCSLTAIAVVEVPATLPVDAHMPEEEAHAKHLLRRAETAGDSYGIKVSCRLARARDPATAIVEAAGDATELLVIGAPRSRSRPFGHTTEFVLKHAGCRVMLIAAPAQPASFRIAV